MAFRILLYLMLFFASTTAIKKFAEKQSDKYLIALFGACVAAAFCFVSSLIFMR